MRISEMISTTPISVEKTVRGDQIRGLTSCRAGKIVPVAYIPLLREDRVTRGSIRIKLDMAETIHPLMNAVNVQAYAHFVPNSACQRFRDFGMEAFNRSYQGIPEPHNGQVIPFIRKIPYTKNSPFWKTLGVHMIEGASVNSFPVEAYNILVNHRRKARSPKLPERTMDDQTLAEAFWKNPDFAYVVPDFDQAMMEGYADVDWFGVTKVPVQGIGITGAGTPAIAPSGIAETDGTTSQGNRWIVGEGRASGTAASAQLSIEQGAAGFPAIAAELSGVGIRLSLANLELAKKTAAFAKLRQQFNGLEDDHIIDLLMEGIRVPDEANYQPTLLDRASTIFGFSERHAMDGANLDMSVTTGETSLELNFRTPPMNTGGIILVTVEIVPEMLHERKIDTYLNLYDHTSLPNFMRDYLDPEKVEPVRNRQVDVHHATPNGIFGYGPLNHHWKRTNARIGGKYFRPNPDTFVEDRQRFWSVEQLNPTLGEDFYLVRNLPHSVFMDTLSDPFEILTLGSASIVGNTVFGPTLEEDNDDYEKIEAQVPTERIALS